MWNKKHFSPFLNISGLIVFHSLLLIYGKLRAIEIYRTKLLTTCFHLMLNFFKKIKRGLELVSLPHFPRNFWRKLSCYILLIDQTSLSGYIYFVRYWAICVVCITIVCKPGRDVRNFEVNLLFLVKPFFLHDQKLATKTKISWER